MFKITHFGILNEFWRLHVDAGIDFFLFFFNQADVTMILQEFWGFSYPEVWILTPSLTKTLIKVQTKVAHKCWQVLSGPTWYLSGGLMCCAAWPAETFYLHLLITVWQKVPLLLCVYLQQCWCSRSFCSDCCTCFWSGRACVIHLAVRCCKAGQVLITADGSQGLKSAIITLKSS